MKSVIVSSFSCFLALTGCGVTLESKRVADGKPTTLIPGEGIVYALPKTEFLVAQNVKLSVPTSGVLQVVFDKCTSACSANGSDTKPKECAFTNEPSLSFAVPQLRTVSLPDTSRLYQISPSADIFQTLDFKFEIGANGVLDKADASGTNLGYEVVAAILKGAAKMTTYAGGSPLVSPIDSGLNQRSRISAAARTCDQTAASVAKLSDKRSDSLLCKLANEITACMAPSERVLVDERVELDGIYKEARTRSMDVKLLSALAAHQRKKIDMAKSQRDEAAARFGLGESAALEASYQIIFQMGSPAEFTAHSQSITLGSSIVDGSSRIVGLSDNAGILLSTFLPLIKAEKRQYKVESEMPKDIAITTEPEAKVVGKGYRYRVPIAAETTLSVFEDSSERQSLHGGPIRDKKVVAQYGPIAALPSSFKGKQGRVMVKHWPDSGGLQTVEIGSEGIPTTAVTGVVEEFVAQRKARKDKADAAAALAAGSDIEIDALTRQEKVLALKKQIKDLEESLNK